MAFLPQNQDQEQQQGQQQNQVPVIPSLQGTSGPSVSQSGGTGATNTASPGAAPSSPWQNVTSYLQANAGQAGNVADTIAGNLQGQYNTANQGIQQANQNFGQQIEQARVPLNADMASQAAQNPSQFAQDPNNVAAFQKMYNAQYSGPQDFSHSQDYSNLQSQVQAAQKQAGLVNQGTPGLMTLLQQAESSGGKNPTQGITALDSLLMQEDPTNFGKLSAAAQPFSGLTDYLGQTQQGLDTSAQKAAQEAAQTQASLQGQFTGPNGVVPTFQNNINQSLQGASKQATDYNQKIADIMGKLNSGQALSYEETSAIDPSGTLQTLNPYGQSSGVFQSMLANGFPGVAPGMLAQFYNAPQQLAQPGLENTMTPQQFADAQALNQMVGPNSVGVPQQLGRQFQVPQSVGSFQSQPALQSLYDTLQGDQSALPQMSSQQLSAYLSDMQALSSYLGLGSAYQGPPIAPTPPPEPPPAALQPPVPPSAGGTSGGTNPGGGRYFF